MNEKAILKRPILRREPRRLSPRGPPEVRGIMITLRRRRSLDRLLIVLSDPSILRRSEETSKLRWCWVQATRWGSSFHFSVPQELHWFSLSKSFQEEKLELKTSFRSQWGFWCVSPSCRRSPRCPERTSRSSETEGRSRTCLPLQSWDPGQDLVLLVLTETPSARPTLVSAIQKKTQNKLASQPGSY